MTEPCFHHKGIQDSIDKIYLIIDGNGKPGMKSDLHDLVKTTKDIEIKLSGYTQVNNELEIARRVEMELRAYKNVKFSRFIKVLGLIIAILTFLASNIYLIFIQP